MKRLFSILLALVLVFALMASFSAAPAVGAVSNQSLRNSSSSADSNTYAFMANGVQLPRPTKKPKPTETPVVTQTIEVHNADEFFKALKSNAVIKLLPGEYDTKDIVTGKYSYFNNRLLGQYGASGPTIKNLKNVKILSDSGARFYLSDLRDSSDFILTLKDCNNVTFENVTFGQEESTPSVDLALYNCKNVTLKNCDLFGWRFEGLSIDKCNSINIEDSKIHDSYGCMAMIHGSKAISFTNTEIFNNAVHNIGVILGNFSDSSGILFSTCNIHDNGSSEFVGGEMFVRYNTKVNLKNCILSSNRYIFD